MTGFDVFTLPRDSQGAPGACIIISSGFPDAKNNFRRFPDEIWSVSIDFPMKSLQILIWSSILLIWTKYDFSTSRRGILSLVHFLRNPSGTHQVYDSKMSFPNFFVTTKILKWFL